MNFEHCGKDKPPMIADARSNKEFRKASGGRPIIFDYCSSYILAAFNRCISIVRTLEGDSDRRPNYSPLM